MFIIQIDDSAPTGGPEMLEEDIALSTLKAAESGETLLLAEVRLEERSTRQLAGKRGQVNSSISTQDAGMNVRIVLPTGIGFASANGISRALGKSLVGKAFRRAKGARGQPWA